MAYKFRLSPTALNLLGDCPRCFWLENAKGVPRPRGIFPSLPNGVDRVLKTHFDKATAKGELPLELAKEKVDAKLFSNLPLLEKWRDSRKGIEWTDTATGVYFHGGVDAMLEKDGKLIVLDFKTRGYALKPDSAHYYVDQLSCYNFLLRKNGFATEDYAYLLFFIPEKLDRDGDFVFDTKLVKVPVDVERVQSLLDSAAKLLSGPIPAPSNECEYCAFVAARTRADFEAQGNKPAQAQARSEPPQIQPDPPEIARPDGAKKKRTALEDFA